MANSKVENEFDEYYNDYYDSILKYCRVRLGRFSENAGDCVQETFLVLYNKMTDGETIEQPRAFLYRTADNFVKRTIEKNQRLQQRTVPLDEIADTESPPTIPNDFDYDKCAKILISMLSSQEQELYKLKYEEKRSLDCISQKLKISPAATAKRTSRLRKKIVDLIKEQNLFGDEVTL